VAAMRMNIMQEAMDYKTDDSCSVVPSSTNTHTAQDQINNYFTDGTGDKLQNHYVFIFITVDYSNHLQFHFSVETPEIFLNLFLSPVRKRFSNSFFNSVH
jgi:hypothetical protein